MIGNFCSPVCCEDSRNTFPIATILQQDEANMDLRNRKGVTWDTQLFITVFLMVLAYRLSVNREMFLMYLLLIILFLNYFKFH